MLLRCFSAKFLESRQERFQACPGCFAPSVPRQKMHDSIIAKVDRKEYPIVDLDRLIEDKTSTAPCARQDWQILDLDFRRHLRLRCSISCRYSMPQFEPIQLQMNGTDQNTHEIMFLVGSDPNDWMFCIIKALHKAHRKNSISKTH